MKINIQFAHTPLRGTYRLAGGMAQVSSPLPFDADAEAIQAALDEIGVPDGIGVSVFSSVLTKALGSTAEVVQAGVAPDSEPGGDMGQRETVKLSLLDNPTAGQWYLQRNDQLIGPFRFDTVASAVAAALYAAGWQCDGIGLSETDSIPRMQFTSWTGVAPSAWSIVPDPNDPLACPCEMSVSVSE